MSDVSEDDLGARLGRTLIRDPFPVSPTSRPSLSVTGRHRDPPATSTGPEDRGQDAEQSADNATSDFPPGVESRPGWSCDDHVTLAHRRIAWTCFIREVLAVQRIVTRRAPDRYLEHLREISVAVVHAVSL
jgi:hypothetical protein